MRKKNSEETAQPDLVCADIIRLLHSEHFAVLATTNGETPHASLIAFTAVDNGAALLFLTPRLTTKFKNIQKNPQVSLLIDSRPRSMASIKSSCALTISGRVKKMANKDCLRLSPFFFKRHPSLSQYETDPVYALIYIKVKSFSHTNSLNRVTKVNPIALLNYENN